LLNYTTPVAATFECAARIVRNHGQDCGMTLYDLWAPVYDPLFGRLLSKGRRRALALLDLQPGQRLFIPGVGTGLNLPAVPTGVEVVAIDLSRGMLARASRRARLNVQLRVMDAQALELPDASFDAVLCNLVISVVPDGKSAMGEAWRVLRPGGRLAIFDKFLPDGARPTAGRRVFGTAARVLGTDVNRHLGDLLEGLPDLTVVCDEPAPLGGRYRVVLLRKHPGDA
jgi:phosphatidylethanolamine/phosphatidyl-N-methylethanolamine N-methyltransferase